MLSNSINNGDDALVDLLTIRDGWEKESTKYAGVYMCTTREKSHQRGLPVAIEKLPMPLS